MKKIIFGIAVLATSLASAQVGIGNTDPKATLDVNKASYTTGEQAGIAVTQQTAAQIEAMTTTDLKAGTLVYATTATGATINAVGYWNWNGTAWVTADENIYKSNGTLTGNREVSLGTNTLAFTSNATSGTSHFTVAGSTLSVDAVNNRVGIGTSIPSSKLHVAANNPGLAGGNGNGDGITIGTSNSTRYAQLRTADFSKGEGWPSGGVLELLQSDNNTSGIKLNTGGNSYLGVNTIGNFGIGTTAPTQKLHVNGGALVSSLAGTGSRMVVADETGVLSTQAIPSGSIADGSETKVNAGTGISVTGSGTTAAPYLVSQAPLAVTVPTTNDYTVVETDAIIYRAITASSTITFPATLPAGKIFYIANTSGSFDWGLSPTPVNTANSYIAAGNALTVVTLGSGQIMVTTGY